MKYFNENEFDCQCGCGLGIDQMDEYVLLMIEEAREIADTPFIITSAIRCKKHNHRIGGSATSSHLSGHALDIDIIDNRIRFIIKKSLYDAGFTRIGDSKGGGFIHVDNDPGKNQFVEWLY